MPKVNLDALISIRSTSLSPAYFDEDVYVEIAEIVLENEEAEKLESFEIRKERTSVHSLNKIHFAVRQKERDES
jgi:hypothetical protein